MAIKIPDGLNAHLGQPHRAKNPRGLVASTFGAGSLTPKVLVASEISGLVGDGLTLTVDTPPTWTDAVSSTWIWEGDTGAGWEELGNADAMTLVLANPVAHKNYHIKATATNVEGDTVRNSNNLALAVPIFVVPDWDTDLDTLTLDLSQYMTSDTSAITYTATGNNIASIDPNTGLLTMDLAIATSTITAGAANLKGTTYSIFDAAVAAVALPVNTAAPVISGTVTDGATLTLDTEPTWADQNSDLYVWQGWDGSTWVDVGTQDTTTFTVGNPAIHADYRVMAKATNTGGTTSVPSNTLEMVMPTMVVGTQNLLQSNLVIDLADFITTATANVGYTATGLNVDSVDVNTGRLTMKSITGTSQVNATITNVAGLAGETFSVIVSPVSLPVPVDLPVISGTIADGEVLTLDVTPTWTGAGTSNWVWKYWNGSSWVEVSETTNATTITLPAPISYADVRVLATATNVSGSSTESSNTLSMPTPSMNLPATLGRTVDGDMSVDLTIYATTSTIAETYAVVSDPGSMVQSLNVSTGALLLKNQVGSSNLTLSVTDPAGTAQDTMFAQVTAEPVPVNTQSPVISGAVADGSTLTLDTSATWTGADSTTHIWQGWTGTAWVQVAGANSTFVAGTPVVHNSYRVLASGSNSGGTSSELSNALLMVEPTFAVPPQTMDGYDLTADLSPYVTSATSAITYSIVSGAATINSTTGLLTMTNDTVQTSSVTAAATDIAGTGESTFDVTVNAVAVPVIDQVPIITGTVAAGQTLTLSTTPTWTGVVDSEQHDWWRRVTDGVWALILGATDQPSILLSDPLLYHEYKVVVSATNLGGTTTHDSNQLVAIPSAPEVVNPATASGEAIVGETLTGIPATFSGNPAPNVANEWEMSADGTTGWTGTGDTDTVFTDQLEGEYYRFTSTGSNGVGSPAVSSSDTIGPAVTIPAQMGAPTLVAQSETEIQVTFAAAPDDGGSAITQYDVQHSTDEASWTLLADFADGSDITGLAAGTEYFVQTRAVNAVGNATWSASASETTIAAATVPVAPVIGTATAGDSTATANWTLTTDDGGAAVIDQEVTRNPGGVVATVGPTITTYQDDTAVNDTAYTYQVSARNSVGSSLASAESNPVTPVSGAVTDFVFTVDGTSGTFTVPTTGTGYNGTIQVNSDTPVAFSDGDMSALSLTGLSGTPTITIAGTFPTIYFNNIAADRAKLLTVENLGDVGWTTLENSFWGCSGMTSFTAGACDTSAVTSFYNAWYLCTDMITFDGLGMDTTSCTTFYSTFQGNTSMTTCDVSSWNADLVNTAQRMFKTCSAVTTLDFSGWGTFPELTTTREMFKDCASLTTIDLSAQTAPKLTTTREMFKDCVLLETVDLTGWTMAGVGDMGSMFTTCGNLVNLSSVAGWDTSSATSMTWMFWGPQFADLPGLQNWNIEACGNLVSFYRSGTLPTATYDAVLIAWEAQTVTPDLAADFGESVRSAASDAAFAELTNPLTNNWTITDGTP